MASNATYVGAVVIEIDGVDIEALNFSYDHNTGRKGVATMNRTGRKKGYCMGTKEWTISFDVPKMVGDAMVDWSLLNKGKLTYYPIEKPWDRTTLRNFFVITVKEDAKVDNELVTSITGEALDLIHE